MNLFISILTKLALALVTEQVAKRAILLALESLSKNTENKIDDEILQIIKDAWNQK